MTIMFLYNLLQLDDLPDHSRRIYQISISKGGLGILDPSSRAILDFVLTMSHDLQYAHKGFHANKEVTYITLPSTLINLFVPLANPEFIYLNIFYHLLTAIAEIAAPPSFDDKSTYLLLELAVSSARSRTNARCSLTLMDDLYCQPPEEHKPHLPGIISSHTSYHLVCMSHSVASCRLDNDLFALALRRKLRLPV